MNPEDRLDQASAPDPVGVRYSRPPQGLPPRPRDRSPFWAAIRDGSGSGWKWDEIQRQTPGTWAIKADGRNSDDLGLAYEVNGFDFEDAGIEPVSQAILLHEVRTGDAAEYWFHYGPIPTENLDFWATVAGNAHAPVYEFDGFYATEVNGVLGIAEGTVVRVFVLPPGCEDDFAFEYAGDSVGVLEDSFDFIEVWPALVVTADASPLHARLWIPGGGFPPAVADNWHLTAAEATEHVAYDQVGAGTFADGTLVPCLADYDAGPPEVADWIQVRCQPGAFVTENAATPVPPDGAINTFSGTLAGPPLPFTVTFEYEVAPGRWKRLISTRTITPADDFKVDFQGPGTGHIHVRTGVWSVELNECPPAGATVRMRYILVSACAWSWLDIPHAVEGGAAPATVSTIGEGWLVVDEERKLAHAAPHDPEEDGDGFMVHIYSDINGEVEIGISADGGANWTWGGDAMLKFDRTGHCFDALVS